MELYDTDTTRLPLQCIYDIYDIYGGIPVPAKGVRKNHYRCTLDDSWNGYMLMTRVTPFNAQDLKVATDAVSLINNYFNGFEIVIVLVGIAAVIIWLISMWRRGGQYEGKIHRLLAIAGVAVCAMLFSFTTDQAIDKRVLSTYFGNIAFAYEDYGLPYCFMSSVFNTGIDEPNDYNKETIDQITNNGEMAENKTGRASDDLPNIIVVQLESYFDVDEAEFFTTSEDACPNLHEMYKNYSSGYFKVPSVGAGTANTEFEVLTGMNMDLESIRIKQLSRTSHVRVLQQLFQHWDTVLMDCTITEVTSTVVQKSMIIWDLTVLQVKSL